MHKAQRGHKLNVVSKVVTPLNFVTPPSFSVTPPSCEPDEPNGPGHADPASSLAAPLRTLFCRNEITPLGGRSCSFPGNITAAGTVQYCTEGS